MRYQDFLDMTALRSYASAINNRAMQYQAVGLISGEIIQAIILESGGRCGWCSKNLVDAEFEIDHITSLSQQGQNTESNLIVACPECNRNKGEKNPLRFALEIVALTGKKSPLIANLLSQHQIDAYVQERLFDDVKTVNSLKHPKLITDSSQSDQVVPYNWKKT